MWLKSKDVGVRFDEKWGGMPMGDSLGLLRCVSIELALKRGPFFQSRNDTHPRMKRHDSGLTASGIMRKKPGKVLKHTYELKAKLEDNELYLDFRLNVPTTERIFHSKIWFLTRWFGKCIVDGKPIKLGEMAPAWKLIKRTSKQPESVVLCNGKASLEIQGSTDPSVYWSLYNLPPFKRERLARPYNNLEIIYVWAEENIEKGTYTGSFKVIYGV